MGSNKGNHPKHGPGYICFKDAKGKKSGKAKKAKQIAQGKKLAQLMVGLFLYYVIPFCSDW
jgi:hypothetical protein